jgi:hypothetical protein
MTYIVIFFATFSYVMFRAFQQRNVAFDNHKWIIPTSYIMAMIDIYIVATVAREGWSIPLVLVNGTAGALGCICAMWFHKRFVQEKA